MTDRKPHQPLSGMRVIDFTHVLAGPACAYMLGLLGADVIKVESPRGDAMRWRGGTDKTAAAEGRSTAWAAQAAGKRSIVLDLQSEFGREAMERLLESADVLVENHLPQTLEALGLTDLTERFPRLIHCAMTGYGRGNDMAGAPAYDVNIQAACGLMAMTGTPDTGPLRTGAPVMDYGTALAASFAVTAALLQREKTGRGSFIDVSMLDTALVLMASTVTDLTATGHVPQPRGNAANSRSPSAGTFPCRTGHLSLGVNEVHQFAALAKTLGRSDWLKDPRFDSRQARMAHQSDLETELIAALQTEDAETWERRLLAAGVPAAALRTLGAAINRSTVRDRGLLFELPSGGSASTLPFTIGGQRYRPTLPPRDLGADTDEILSELNMMPGADAS